MVRTIEAECGYLSDLGLITFEQIGGALTGEWLPAWVQAIGSVVAIGASGYFFYSQHLREKQRDADRAIEQRKSRVRSLFAMIDAASNHAAFLIEQMPLGDDANVVSVGGYVGYAQRDMRAYREQIARYDLSGIEEALVHSARVGFVGSLDRLDEALQFTRRWADTLISKTPEMPKGPQDTLRMQLDMVRQSCEHFRRIAEITYGPLPSLTQVRDAMKTDEERHR